jgi:hypothetical protein
MSDAMAIGVIWAAREAGLRVPEDLSVVGFDDLELASHANPPLTTVHQPIRQKGEESARLLLRMIASRDVERPEHRVLETRLIIRASTGPAPAPRPGPVAAPVVAPGPGIASSTGPSPVPVAAPATSPALTKPKAATR